jgi:hypothetical protein
MHDAEDLESLPDLHALCSLMQTTCKFLPRSHGHRFIVHAVMLNDQSIYEYVLRDDMFVDMVGILECESFLIFDNPSSQGQYALPRGHQLSGTGHSR